MLSLKSMLSVCCFSFALTLLGAETAWAQCRPPAAVGKWISAVRNGDGYDIYFQGALANFTPDNAVNLLIRQGPATNYTEARVSALAVLSKARNFVVAHAFHQGGLSSSDRLYFSITGYDRCARKKVALTFSGTRTTPVAWP